MEKTEIRVFDVDFNNLAVVDGRDCVIASRRGAEVVVGDRVVANDDPEAMTVPGEVVRVDVESGKIWIRLDWFEGLS